MQKVYISINGYDFSLSSGFVTKNRIVAEFNAARIEIKRYIPVMSEVRVFYKKGANQLGLTLGAGGIVLQNGMEFFIRERAK